MTNQEPSEAKMLQSVDTWLSSSISSCIETTKAVPQLVQIHKKIFSDLESKMALTAQKAANTLAANKAPNYNNLSKSRPTFK